MILSDDDGQASSRAVGLFTQVIVCGTFAEYAESPVLIGGSRVDQLQHLTYSQGGKSFATATLLPVLI
jgi:hypothetical protein